MDGSEVALIGLAALGGATLTGVAGVGGGILLLTVLLQFMDPADAIPVHAVIQLASNGSRAALLRRDVDWPTVWAFAALLLPAGVVGLWIAGWLPESAGRVAIAVFALLATWWPTSLGAVSTVLGTGRRGFVSLGAAAGVLNIPLGVTGPAIAPFFRRALSDRRRVVATFAVAQVAGHLAKIVIFGGDGFAFGDHLALVAVGTVAVVAGSWLGTRMLGRVSEVAFGRIFKVALTVVAVRIVVTALW